jgi:hypothetical protein
MLSALLYFRTSVHLPPRCDAHQMPLKRETYLVHFCFFRVFFFISFFTAEFGYCTALKLARAEPVVPDACLECRY